MISEFLSSTDGKPFWGQESLTWDAKTSTLHSVAVSVDYDHGTPNTTFGKTVLENGRVWNYTMTTESADGTRQEVMWMNIEKKMENMVSL